MQRKMKMFGLIVAASVLSTSVWAGRSSGGQAAPQNQFQNQPQNNPQINRPNGAPVNLSQIHQPIPANINQQRLRSMTPAQRQLYYHQQLSQLHGALGFSPEQTQAALGQHNRMLSSPNGLAPVNAANELQFRINESQAHLRNVQNSINTAVAAARADGRVTPSEQMMIDVLRHTQATHNDLLQQRQQQLAAMMQSGAGF